MTAIIILSHGSRHPEAEGGIGTLARAVESLTGMPTVAAHLEFTAPSLADAARSLRAAGVTEAVVVPLLFTRGYHATYDVPQVIQAAENVSGLTLRHGKPLGAGADVAQLLAGRVRDSHAHLVVYAVGSANVQANQDVERLAVRVADLTGQSTSVVFATRGGRKALAEQRALYGRVEILPLFVTQGLLLDAAGPDARPLGDALAPIVAARAGQVFHSRALAKVGA